jgi:eukaryotic-like serine/threonine-protein kinase
MTPDQWAHVEALFAAALSLPPEARSPYLAAECGSNTALRREVESLLAEHLRAPEFLDAPAWLTEAEPASIPVAERIGPYRILRLLGRGGMGQVYLAEREAEGFRQQVALKVMRRGMDTDDLIARFRTERQILGTLSHPNIARLLDVGATVQGTPYLVMEYVDGVPLLEYCDARRLDVRERLVLFRAICDAVQHAHRRLIVHRDLKPQNILVTHDGAPKLLDFGIAKIIDPQGAEFTTPHTNAGMRLLTPDHAAPEQLRGDPITTTCDVYALGVLLYQLLVGRHPYEDARRSRAEMERRVLESEPSPPSAVVDGEHAAARRTTAAQLERQLAGDLDTIVLAAMRKEPEARYASPFSLSEDLDRHLTGRPVEARPSTARYRLAKFVARNRLGVATAAVLFLVLTGAMAVTTYQWRRAQRAAVDVMRERDKALEVRGFLLEMFGATGPDRATGDTVTARQLLDRRAATLDASYPNDPETRADMLFALAEGYEKLGLLTEADPLARRSLETRRAVFGAGHPDVVASLDLVGWLAHERGKPSEAEVALGEAIAIGRRVFPPQGDTRLARALNDLGVVREARGDYPAATALYREALAMRNRLGEAENVSRAVTLSNLSVIYYRTRQLDSAIATARAALGIFRRVLGEDHQRTTVVQTNLAAMQSAKGDHAGALEQHREVLARRRRLFGARHPAVAQSIRSVAAELFAMGRQQEAEARLLEAMEIHRSVDGPARDSATTLSLLGDLRAATRPAEALADYRSALATTRQVYGDVHESVRSLLARMAVLYEKVGQLDEAERALRDGVRAAGTGPGNRSLDMRLRVVELFQRRGDTASARAELLRITQMVPSNAADSDTVTATRLRTLREALQLR